MELYCDGERFLAIRMIVVHPDGDKDDFKDWMTGEGEYAGNGFLDEMGRTFQDSGLEWIIFLKGNKEGRQSYQGAGTRGDSTAAGANADFAWITCWESKEINEDTWKQERTDEWYEKWREFREKCHPRRLSGVGNPHRPEHGPPYDFYGMPGPGSTHHGKGAGCLVEGFDVIYIMKEPWPEQKEGSSL